MSPSTFLSETLLPTLMQMLMQTFWVLYEGGLYVLVGFALAGAIHVFVDPDRVVRRIGARSLRSATLAALVGAPLPLCSCGVLPTALSLRRKGASREATISFLISTPETGVDSIAVTWAFFGPVLAVIRPLVAIVTSLVAAAFSLRQPDDTVALDTDAEPEPAAARRGAAPQSVEPLHEHLHEPPPEGAPPTKLRRALRYAFVDLFDDLGFWLAFAIVLTGMLSALLPTDFFARVAPGSLASMLLMVALGVPLYVCASASTPLAAVFVAKGLSVGAALVFLLVGPATNAATIGAISRILGRPFLRVYLGSIVGVALLAGLALDLVAPDLGRNVQIGAEADGSLLALAKSAGAVALGALILASLRRTGLRTGLRELGGNARAAAGWVATLRPGPILRSRFTHALLGLAIAIELASAFVTVPPGFVGLVQRFGQLAGPPVGPGLHFAFPGVERIELVHVEAVRSVSVGYRLAPGGLVRQPVSDEAIYLTGDENVIDLRTEAQFRIADPVAYALGAEAPDAALALLVRARLVDELAGRAIDRIYTDARREIEASLLAAVRGDVERLGLGIELLAVRLLDVHAPSPVHEAFRDVASAHEEKLTTQHRAREYAAGVVALARGEAAKRVAEAKATAGARLAAARGDTAAFRALAAEHARAPGALEDRLTIEAAERTLPGVKKIVQPPASARGYELWLRGSSASEWPGAPALPGAAAGPPAGASPAPIAPAPQRKEGSP